MKRLSVCAILLAIIGLATGCDIFGTGDPPETRSLGLQKFGISGIYANGDYVITSPSSKGSYNYIFRSVNNGSNWTCVDSLNVMVPFPPLGLSNSHTVNFDHVTFISNGTSLFAGIGGWQSAGLYVSTDNGKTWMEKDSNFVESINCFARIDETIFAGTNHGVFMTMNNGISWMADTSGMPYPVVGLTASGGTLFVASTNNGVFRSTNNGRSWNKVYTDNFGVEGGLVTVGKDVLVGASVGTGTAGGVLTPLIWVKAGSIRTMD